MRETDLSRVWPTITPGTPPGGSAGCAYLDPAVSCSRSMFIWAMASLAMGMP